MKVRSPQHFDEIVKATSPVLKNELPRDNGLDRITIHYPAINCANANIVFAYELSSREIPRTAFEETVSAGLYVRDSCVLVFEDGESGAQSWESHVLAGVICSNATVSTTSFSSDGYPAKLGSLVLLSDSEVFSNEEKAILARAQTAGEVPNMKQSAARGS